MLCIPSTSPPFGGTTCRLINYLVIISYFLYDVNEFYLQNPLFLQENINIHCLILVILSFKRGVLYGSIA